MILEAYHPAPVQLFSSVDRQFTLSLVLDYPTPAIASRNKTTRPVRLPGQLHHYTGRVPAQALGYHATLQPVAQPGRLFTSE